MTALLKIRVLENPEVLGARFVAEYMTSKIGVVGLGVTETGAKGDLAAQAAWYAPGDPEYLAVVANDPDVLRAAVDAARRYAAKRRVGADVDLERDALLRSAAQWDRAAERLQVLLDKTLPAFHVEGAVVYLRNDLTGAPVDLLGELSRLTGKGSIRTDADKTAAPPVPGYRPWATVKDP